MKRRLDFTTLAGVPLGIGLVLAGQWLEGGELDSLLQLTAAVIVFGGTAGATLMSFPLKDIRQALWALHAVWYEDPDPSDNIIAFLVQVSSKARKHGIMSLDDDVGRVQNPFLRRGLGLAVDGMSPTALREMLEAESLNREERDERPARVFEAAGGYAPTIGILGAVLGLIHVMGNLSDPSKLGGGIAVAFVATVYGVGVANLVLLPVAAKLRNRAHERSRHRELIIEGVLAVQEGLNPRLLDQKLRGLVPLDEGKPAGPRAA